MPDRNHCRPPPLHLNVPLVSRDPQDSSVRHPNHLVRRNSVDPDRPPRRLRHGPATAPCWPRRTADGHWGRRTVRLRPVHRHRPWRPSPLVRKHDPASPHAAPRRPRPRMAAGAPERRRRLGATPVVSHSKRPRPPCSCRAAFHIAGTGLGMCRTVCDGARRPGWPSATARRPAEHGRGDPGGATAGTRTFSVPILMTAALAGLVDWHEGAGAGRSRFGVACRRSWYRFRPAAGRVVRPCPPLIAIGQAIYHHRPSRNPLAPASCGSGARGPVVEGAGAHPNRRAAAFLEATPLTSFVGDESGVSSEPGERGSRQPPRGSTSEEKPRGAERGPPLAGAGGSA